MARINQPNQPSEAWVTFSYLNVLIALGLAAAGVWWLPVDLWQKGFLAMAFAMVTSSTVIATKTVRDRMDARAEPAMGE